jgi:hypothetical protein
MRFGGITVTILALPKPDSSYTHTTITPFMLPVGEPKRFTNATWSNYSTTILVVCSQFTQVAIVRNSRRNLPTNSRPKTRIKTRRITRLTKQLGERLETSNLFNH